MDPGSGSCNPQFWHNLLPGAFPVPQVGQVTAGAILSRHTVPLTHACDRYIVKVPHLTTAPQIRQVAGVPSDVGDRPGRAQRPVGAQTCEACSGMGAKKRRLMTVLRARHGVDIPRDRFSPLVP